MCANEFIRRVLINMDERKEKKETTYSTCKYLIFKTNY